MEALTLEQVAQATGGRLLTPALAEQTIHDVCTDSRKIKKGCLFLPLVGDRFDGHDYIDSALEHGALAVLTAKEPQSPVAGRGYILVSDTQDALRDLAVYYRNLFHIPVIAVTGSVGKTTTKDMVAAVLGEKYNVLKTDGNFNNNIGLPLTIFRLTHAHEIAVLEMGMNHLGEIDYLTRIARPDVALITNIGDAHIENLGCRENTLKAKAEVFHGMTAEGRAVLNGDDVLLRTLDGRIDQAITWCGAGSDNDWRGEELCEQWDDHMTCTLASPTGSWEQYIPGLGAHMIYPVTMAAAVGRMFGLTDEQINRGILEFEPTKMRMAILHRGDDITILNDTYNANPQSMRAALDILSKQSSRKRIAVLGDMLELGDLGPSLHQSVGRFLGIARIDCLVTVGKLAEYIADGAEESGVSEIYRCANQAQAQKALAQAVIPGSTVLVKASRGMRFEHLVEYLAEITPEKQS
ncbi:MAG: UDP-N-acetylmuramoyl-tripeptide--D-alanyl-D-alanine ligase [Oscillospiraceae bacterium]|nr:UDP-N-acetylmuramoyl-tripeptide--D-alanyl-D-alanine ligase [Oscillospiraceae bacterium]